MKHVTVAEFELKTAGIAQAHIFHGKDLLAEFTSKDHVALIDRVKQYMSSYPQLKKDLFVKVSYMARPA